MALAAADVAEPSSLLALLVALPTMDEALETSLWILLMAALMELLTALSVAVEATELKLEMSLLALFSILENLDAAADVTVE